MFFNLLRFLIITLFYQFPIFAAGNLRTLVFYTSDDPETFRYFSHSFTERIQKETPFQAHQESIIANTWAAGSVHFQESADVESEITKITENLKNSVKKNRKSMPLVLHSEKQLEILLSNNPVEVSNHILAEFHFWCVVASALEKKIAKNHISGYEKYASLAQKDILESQIDASLLSQIQNASDRANSAQQQIQILGSQNCLVFINGQMNKSDRVSLPKNLNSVVSANCSTGVFSQTFLPSQVSFLKIEPIVSNHFEHMPPFSALPKDLIAKEKVEKLIFIHWAKEKKYVDSVVLNAKDFSILKSIHLTLSSPKDFDRSGDRLIGFLQSSEVQ